MSPHSSPAATPLFRPAGTQAPVPDDQLLHSANAGFLIHRSGLIKYEFRSEGLAFASELVKFINPNHAGYVTVFLYEELLGTYNRLHWLLHLKQPNDYQRLLDMVDHDARWQEIADMDRLPAKGGGGWERMFIEGSIQETIMCPQHGVGHGDDDHQTFQPSAQHQTTLPADRLLHSGNSGVTVHRVVQAQYALREEARLFNYEWASYLTEALAGRASAFLYEEMWGRQDRLHTLIHLDSMDGYQDLQRFLRDDKGLHDLMARQWVPTFKGGGGWEQLFVDGSMTETLLAPWQRPVEE